MQLSLLATALLVIAPAALANPKPKKHCTLTEQPCASLANPYTATVYEHTVTETEAVDCGGCTAIAVSTRFCGLGLPLHITTTEVVPTTTLLTRVCSQTP